MSNSDARFFGILVLSLFALSSFLIPVVVDATGPSSVVIPNGQISTHGPRINQLIIEFESDNSAFLSVQSGTIPAMEWSLSLAQYATAESSSTLFTTSTTSYDFDGIAFNFMQFPYNNTHFRAAIADLTDYATIQTQLGPTIAAGNNIYNPTLYPLYYNSLIANPYSYNLTKAMQQLELVPGVSYNPTTGAWTLNGKAFSPELYSRGDDLVIREPIAQLLVTDAALINLTITNNEITGSDASADIYGPAGGAVISTGVMGSNYSTITPPVFNYTDAATSDTWGMYTFGWIVSFEPTYTWAFFNSALAGIDDFGNFYNATMDYWTNILDYANSSTVAQEAASNIQQIDYQQLPYIVWGWQNTLYAVNPSSGSGWTGFTNLETLGPSESTGLLYTALNVHPAHSATGGTYYEAIHQAPTSLDPLYQTNWIWDVDVWEEVYDYPLEYAPTNNGVLDGSLIPWMASWSITNNSNAAIGSGPGWYNPTNAKSISGGQVLTFNFYKNETWDDGVPLTAYDFNQSIYLWDVMGNAPTSTPESYDAPPPLGLLATYIPPNDPQQIQLYVNSTTLWNVYLGLSFQVLPWHIFQYFNASTIATSTGAVDLTKPYSTSAYSSYLKSGVTVPEYIQWLPNLEVGSGAFDFQSWNTVTNVMNLTRNVNYYRSAWTASNTTVTQGSNATVTPNIYLEIYNPTSSTYGGVSPGATGDMPITNATGTVSVLRGNSVVSTASLTGGSGGSYSASIGTGSLSPGYYEVMVNASYSAFGLNRIWYSYSGLIVSPSTTTTVTTSSSSSVTSNPVSTTSSSSMIPTTTSTSTTAPPTSVVSTTSTSSSTTTSTSSDILIAAVVVIIIIVIAGAAMMMRRRGPPAGGSTPASAPPS